MCGFLGGLGLSAIPKEGDAGDNKERIFGVFDAENRGNAVFFSASLF